MSSRESTTKKGKCIIFSAPSGAGKTTIVHALLKRMNYLSFSISACSRPPRDNELNGKDYYFLSKEEFKRRIRNDDFIEWEEVYKDHYYGTLKEEVERIWNDNKTVLFDVDVQGGMKLKEYFQDEALSFFIHPPSIEVLEKRLRKRETETEDKIQLRLRKARRELSYFSKFDTIVINDDLEEAIKKVEKKVNEFLNQ